ncbi:DUF6221 family protein [Nocardia tengchongensis]
MTLEEFIEARIAAREAAANEAIEFEKYYQPDEFIVEYQWVRFTRRSGEGGASSMFMPGAAPPREVLRECAATRDALGFALAAFGEESKIEERAGRDPETNSYDRGRADTVRYMLRVLAAAWSDHPDYRPEWAVDGGGSRA